MRFQEDPLEYLVELEKDLIAKRKSLKEIKMLKTSELVSLISVYCALLDVIRGLVKDEDLEEFKEECPEDFERYIMVKSIFNEQYKFLCATLDERIPVPE